jgi:hypothetical protein
MWIGIICYGSLRFSSVICVTCGAYWWNDRGGSQGRFDVFIVAPTARPAARGRCWKARALAARARDYLKTLLILDQQS